MMKTLLFSLSFLFIATLVNSQACTPQGDETTYGTNNVWIGYVYDNADLTNYKGYVNEGNVANPDFDESFGGDNTDYATNGCPVNTSTFSVRYKLSKTFASGSYIFTVGGDDGYRLSIDGGSSWLIDNWHDQSYTTSSYMIDLDGSYDLVLEFYENGGANRVSFTLGAGCNGNTNIYGTNNIWNAYVYDGTNFDLYRGMINTGSAGDMSFDEDFGGSNTTFTTSCTSVQTETFSVRFRLNKTFANSSYTFFVGGDDGYRLSLDGGNTWVIDRWVLQSYTVTSYTVTLDGNYDIVLEYYENGGDNRISLSLASGIPLPVKLISFSGAVNNNNALLRWTVAGGSNPDSFNIEKSTDGVNFSSVGTVKPSSNINMQADMTFSYTDAATFDGKSFYRLKITDLHGLVTYSKTISLTLTNTKENAVRIFPTLINGNSTVSIQSTASIQEAVISVINNAGVQISHKILGPIHAGQSTGFATGTLSKGIYFIRIMDGNTIIDTKKIMVQ